MKLRLLMLASAFTLLSAGTANAVTLSPFWQPAAGRWHAKIILAFDGTDGAIASGSVIMDSTGTLYGTTGGGGPDDAGVAFALRRTGGGWKETVLHTFDGYDGDSPVGALLPGPNGVYFGATSSGGADCQGAFCLGGTVYELLPPASGHGAWTINVLHNFSVSDPAGAAPAGTLLADSHGNLYGSAQLGGSFGDGTIFELKPPRAGSQEWITKVLHTFNPQEGDGLIPTRGLIADGSGTLYGTTEDGGNGTACIDGCGTFFSLSPPSNGHGDWTEHILYNFTNTNGDGSLPYVGVTPGSDGSFYGTTDFGGTSNGGIAYRLTPTSSGTWAETILHEFSQSNGDGYNPVDELTAGPKDTFYGTTSFGGKPGNSGGGIVFRLTPPRGGSGAWNEEVLQRFDFPRIADSWASVFRAPDGVLYGSTVVGGGSPACSQGCGTIFSLTPP